MVYYVDKVSFIYPNILEVNKFSKKISKFIRISLLQGEELWFLSVKETKMEWIFAEPEVTHLREQVLGKFAITSRNFHSNTPEGLSWAIWQIKHTKSGQDNMKFIS